MTEVPFGCVNCTDAYERTMSICRQRARLDDKLSQLFEPFLY